MVDVSSGAKARAASTFRGSALGRLIAAPVPPSGTQILLYLVRVLCVYSSVVTQRIVFDRNTNRERIGVFRVVILKGDCKYVWISPRFTTATRPFIGRMLRPVPPSLLSRRFTLLG